MSIIATGAPAPVVSRLHATRGCAPNQHNQTAPKVSRLYARSDRPRRAKEKSVNNLNSILLEGNLAREPATAAAAS